MDSVKTKSRVNNNKETSLTEIAYLAIIAVMCFVGFVCSAEIAVYTSYFVIAFAICLFSPKMELLTYIIPFLYIMPSVSNNPSNNADSIFSNTNNLIYLACLGVIILIVITCRIIHDNKGKKLQMPKLTGGFVFLGIAYLFSGFCSGFESLQNCVYALAQIASLCVFYFITLFAVDWNRTSKNSFAWMGFFVGFVVLLEICYIYISQDKSVFEIMYQRSSIYTGWGMYNNIGGYLIMTIPCLFYLACTQKDSWIYLIWGFIFYVGVILTTSRGSMLAGGIVLLLSCITSIIAAKGKRQKLQIAITLIVLIIISLIVAGRLVKNEDFKAIIDKLIESKDSYRFKIYKQGIEQFLQYPIFGAGFYECDVYQYGKIEIVIPPRWHNTIIQLLATAGVVGIIAYAYHRAETIVLIATKRAKESVFIGFCVLAFLISSLLDNHFFNFGPGLLYGIYLAFAEGLPKEENKDLINYRLLHTDKTF